MDFWIELIVNTAFWFTVFTAGFFFLAPKHWWKKEDKTKDKDP